MDALVAPEVQSNVSGVWVRGPAGNIAENTPNFARWDVIGYRLPLQLTRECAEYGRNSLPLAMRRITLGLHRFRESPRLVDYQTQADVPGDCSSNAAVPPARSRRPMFSFRGDLPRRHAHEAR